PDRAHLVHLVGVLPDVNETPRSHVAGRKRKLDAGKDVAVGRHIATSVAGAAWQVLQRVLIVGRDRAEFFYVAYQRRITEDLPQFFLTHAQTENAAVAIHHGRNGGIESAFHAEFRAQRANSWVVRH